MKEYFPKTDTYQDPFAPWQAMGLTLTLAVVAAIGGWMGYSRLVVPALVVATVVVFSVDAATTPGTLIVNGRVSGGGGADANFWPLGAVLLAIGAALGFSLVAGGSHVVSQVVAKRQLGTQGTTRPS